MVRPENLRPHPVSLKIYGEETGADLVASIAEHGILEPLVVTSDNLLIAGHRRRAASLTAGVAEVPAITVESGDDTAIVDLLLTANLQRVKTNLQLAREAAVRMKIEQEKARRRQAAAGAKVPATSPEASGDARTIVGKQMGVGGKKIDQYVAVIGKIDELDASGDTAQRNTIQQALKKSVNKAYNKVVVLNERAKLASPASTPVATKASGKVAKADIITRLQDDLAEGMEIWSVESLLAFEEVLAAFKADWFATNGEEAA